MLAILQARMTSSRLPGKVLEPLEGAPMILRQIERIRRSEAIGGLVVATSTDPSDDRLAAALKAHDVTVVRGSLDDVLARFIAVIDQYETDAVVRLTADCPLASPAVIDAVVNAFTSNNLDYCSNTLVPTYPDGVDVEVVRAGALRWVNEHSADRAEHEHVTLGVYRRPDRFRLHNVTGPQDLSDLRWTVDTPEDLSFVRAVYAELYAEQPAFELEDVLELLRRRPDLSRTSADAARNAALDGLDTGAMRHRAASTGEPAAGEGRC